MAEELKYKLMHTQCTSCSAWVFSRIDNQVVKCSYCGKERVCVRIPILTRIPNWSSPINNFIKANL